MVDWYDAKANNQPEEFTALELNGRFKLVQGTGQARQVEVGSPANVMKPSAPQSDVARAPLVVRLPLPLTKYRTFGGTETRLRSQRQYSWIARKRGAVG